MVDLIYPISPAPVLRGGADVKASEMLPVIDVHGAVKYQASREYCHGGAKPLHPVVHLHIINHAGCIYLQLRSAKKDLLPLKWDTAVGGHITYGEYVREALYREAGEELGFYDFNPHWLLSYVFESQAERELVNVFATVGDYVLKPDREEVAEGRWWSIPEIEAAIGQGGLTPNFESEFPRVKDSLLALL